MANDDRQKARPADAGQPAKRPAGPGKAADRQAATRRKGRAGIGSSQGQDSGSRERSERRPSAGTPDIERGGGGGDVERGASSRESLVQDPTGAFKERP